MKYWIYVLAHDRGNTVSITLESSQSCTTPFKVRLYRNTLNTQFSDTALNIAAVHRPVQKHQTD